MVSAQEDEEQEFVEVLVVRSGSPELKLRMRRGLLLWSQLRKAGLPIGSSCSGVGVCGACAVKVIKGHENLQVEEEFERDVKVRNKIPGARRVACLVRVWGDATIQF